MADSYPLLCFTYDGVLPTSTDVAQWREPVLGVCESAKRGCRDWLRRIFFLYIMYMHIKKDSMFLK